jgi:hypothetical protein
MGLSNREWAAIKIFFIAVGEEKRPWERTAADNQACVSDWEAARAVSRWPEAAAASAQGKSNVRFGLLENFGRVQTRHDRILSVFSGFCHLPCLLITLSHFLKPVCKYL